MSKRFTDTKDPKPTSTNRVLVCSAAVVFRPPHVSVDVSFAKMIAPNFYTPEQEVSPDDAQRLCDSPGSGVQWMTGDEIEALERTVPKGTAKFERMTSALIGHFDKPLGNLPPALRERVEDDPKLRLLWDKATPAGREKLAEQLDYQRDPATENEREHAQRLWCEIDAARREVAEVEARGWTDFTNRAARNDQLDAARKRLEDVERQYEKEFPDDVAPHGANAVPSPAIKMAFAIPGARSSDKWWKDHMREAKRNELVQCRASAGRSGITSYWYPDQIAGWLVDRKHLKSGEAARLLRQHFPECAAAADLLDSTGEA